MDDIDRDLELDLEIGSPHNDPSSLEMIHHQQQQQHTHDNNNVSLFQMQRSPSSIAVGAGHFTMPGSMSTSASNHNIAKLGSVRRMSLRERLQKLERSWLFIAYMVAMALLCGFLLVWSIFVPRASSWWFITLETLVTVAIVFEFLLRMLYVEGPRRYYRKWFNWIDMIMTVLCVASFVLVLITAQGTWIKDIGAVAEVTLFGFRYLVQLLRICIFVTKHPRQRRRQQFIDLESASMSDLESNAMFEIFNDHHHLDQHQEHEQPEEEESNHHEENKYHGDNHDQHLSTSGLWPPSKSNGSRSGPSSPLSNGGHFYPIE